MQIWKCSEISSPIKRIASNLLIMAQFRGATTSKEILALYSKRLASCPIDLAERAIIDIAEQAPESGETLFPPIGKILTLMRSYESERCRLIQPLPDGTMGRPEKRKF